ncbi:MAG TPA: GNAT family protein [Acetobacteraceae bacterium]|nr:GNAT family protein [Acetobacteraceae bacterium]
MADRTNAYGQPIGAPVPDWTARRRPARAPLGGRYCRLEPVSVERHGRELFESYMQAPDDRDWTYLFSARPPDVESFRNYLLQLEKSEDPLHFSIIDLANGVAVGTAALMRIEPAHGVIEVGSITYSPRLKHTRAGTEAIYLFMRLAFDELGYRRFEWKCDSLNGPSRRAAQRYGFTFEGIFRQAVVYKGRNRHTAWFSIIDREWPRLKERYTRWLDPANFDADGRQRMSLGALLGADA